MSSEQRALVDAQHSIFFVKKRRSELRLRTVHLRVGRHHVKIIIIMIYFFTSFTDST